MAYNSTLPQKTFWACSLGTLLEWYDFFIFAIMAPTIAANFFDPQDKQSGFLLTLIAFTTSFISRPIGGIIFGYIGDRLGRKPSLLISLALMGVSSTLMAVAPTYSMWGLGASAIIFVIRFVQGLALGGEYGGAATYIAEQSQDHNRATQTAYLQITPTLGFVFALLMVSLLNVLCGVTMFEAWGWRIAFLISLLWLIPSYFIRRDLMETSIFKSIRAKKTLLANPIKVLLGTKKNIQLVAIAVLGLTMGQSIMSYAGFYSMYFIQSYETLQNEDLNIILIISSLSGIPAIIIAGKWADKTSYKRVILIGMFLGIILYFPIFSVLEMLASTHTAKTPLSLSEYITFISILSIQKIAFSIIYAPIIAQMTIMFPTRIRYSGISLAYNIGNGVFGGTFLPIVTYLAIHPFITTSYYDAMIYPIIITLVSMLIGFFYLPSKKN